MADFVQTMKDWRRMCKSYTQCGACPLYKYDPGKCGRAVEHTEQLLDKLNYSIVEDTVNKWAAEHPEPVYPTWGTWLAEKYDFDLREIMYAPIPADIAQKLGIEPKEG